LGHDFALAVRDVIATGPTVRYRRARQDILDACPEFEEDWACDYVAWLVGAGQIPESSLAKCLARFRRRVMLGHRGELPAIVVKRGYLGVCLRRMVTHEYGLPWRAAHRKERLA
jgi:hypothetical protein